MVCRHRSRTHWIPRVHLTCISKLSWDYGIAGKAGQKTWNRPHGSADSQQFLVKSANLPRPVNEVNLQNPMALLAVGVKIAHAPRIFRMHIEGHFIAGNPFMGKLPDQVAGDRTAKFPAIPFG